MGNSSARVPIVHDGPVSGLLDQGTIISNMDATPLDPLIVQTLFDSIGDDLPIVAQRDQESFDVELQSPKCPNFKPFFFDRREEYGENHVYLEAMCHSFPNGQILDCPSARCFLNTSHPPATLPICAFVEAIRHSNANFLSDLKEQVTRYANSQEDERKRYPEQKDIDDLLEGAFRSVAIQIHHGAESRDRKMLTHMDHVFSALHMGVTLHGNRSVGFVLPGNQEKTLEMKAGDIYVTTPAGILHGASMKALQASDKSCALQCRTLFSKPSALVWERHAGALCAMVAETLVTTPFYLPTKECFCEQLERLKKEFTVADDVKFKLEYRTEVSLQPGSKKEKDS